MSQYYQWLMVVFAFLGLTLCGTIPFNGSESKPPEEFEFLEWLAELQGMKFSENDVERDKAILRKLADTTFDVEIVSSLYQCFLPGLKGVDYAKSSNDYTAHKISEKSRSWTIIQPAIGESLCASLELHLKVSSLPENPNLYVRVSVFAKKTKDKWSLVEFHRTRIEDALNEER